jgi:hypothetical protein
MSYVLVVVTLLIAAAGLFKDIIPKNYRRLFVLLYLFMLVIISVFQTLVICREHTQARYSKDTGILKSPTKSRDDHPILALCESRLVYSGPDGTPMFKLGDDPVVLKMKDGAALLSMVIRDKSGIVRVMIRDNVWFAPKSEGVLDRNFDDNTLEVLGPKNEIALQVQIHGAEVRLAGTMYTKEGVGPISFGPLLTECNGRGGTIFQYPSAEFPGKQRITQ